MEPSQLRTRQETCTQQVSSTHVRQPSAGHSRQVSPDQLHGQIRDPVKSSVLERLRAEAVPLLPATFARPNLCLQPVPDSDSAAAVPPELAKHFSKLTSKSLLQVVDRQDDTPTVTKTAQRLGILNVSSSVAAAGTHNVILGLKNFLEREWLDGSELLAIRNFATGNEFSVTGDSFGHFLNQGGSDLLPTMPLKRVTPRILGQVALLAKTLKLNGMLFLCGPEELAEVTKIAEHIEQAEQGVSIAAVLQSSNGSVRLPGWLETNLGFDSACGQIREIAGNTPLNKLSLSEDNYHILCCGSFTLTLEVALQIRPTLCYIGEDVAQRNLTLQELCDEICDVIVARHHDHGLRSGVIMVSADLFERLVEMQRLRQELHRLRRERPKEMVQMESARQVLPVELRSFFDMLPVQVCRDLIYQTGIDGLPLLRPQDVARDLGDLVARCMSGRAERGDRCVPQFAYHPRNYRNLAACPMPSLLDCTLGYALGSVAGLLLQQGANGYVASVCGMECAPDCWRLDCWKPCAVPLVRLLHIGIDNVPRTRLHQLADEGLLKVWQHVRDNCRYRLSYRNPGPVQYYGPADCTQSPTFTLQVACNGSAGLIAELEATLTADQSYVVHVNPPLSLPRRQDRLLSSLQRWRCGYQPRLPRALRGAMRILENDTRGSVCADQDLVGAAFPALRRANELTAVTIAPTQDQVNILHMLPESPAEAKLDYKSARSPSGSEADEVSKPLAFDLKEENPRIGVCIAGRLGPGINNIIQGLYDYLQTIGGTVICIAMGISGLMDGHAFTLTDELLRPYCNTGGCDLLGQSAPESLCPSDHIMAQCASTARKFGLHGLVVWGGRKTHMWTAQLAEFFADQQVPTRVIAVPASVESNLPLCEQTLGHDTVCKLYGSVIGNLSTQASSSGKTWHLVRIPGHSVSHICSEVALQCWPHVVLVSAHVQKDDEKFGMSQVVQMVCDVIESRSHSGLNFGVIIIPDQFLIAVREMQQLFEEIDQIRIACPEALESMTGVTRDFEPILNLLSPLTRAVFYGFPERVRTTILREDALSGSADTLRTVETDVILQALVEAELTRRVVLGVYKGPFQCHTHQLPDHGRAATPTTFDCDLGYSIGFAAGVLVNRNYTGLLVDVTKLKENVEDWEVGGIPLSSLMKITVSSEEDGRVTSVIAPRDRLSYDVTLRCLPDPCLRPLVTPGPIQFSGPAASAPTHTLMLPQAQRVRQMTKAEQLIAELRSQASTGCPPEVLQAVRMLLQGGVDLIRQL